MNNFNRVIAGFFSALSTFSAVHAAQPIAVQPKEEILVRKNSGTPAKILPERVENPIVFETHGHIGPDGKLRVECKSKDHPHQRVLTRGPATETE